MDEKSKDKNNILVLGIIAIVGIVAISLGYFSFASGFKEKNLVGGADYGLATDSDLAGEASQLPSQVAVNTKCAVLKTQINNYAKILDTYTKQYNSQCICPKLPECTNLVPGCRYSGGKDANGCPTCGKIICQESCGNGVKEKGEDCDGVDFGGPGLISNCQDFAPYYNGGKLYCTKDCKVDTSGCTKI